MATISWKLTEKQEKYINDKHKYLLVEGSAGSGKTIFAVHKVILYALNCSTIPSQTRRSARSKPPSSPSSERT